MQVYFNGAFWEGQEADDMQESGETPTKAPCDCIVPIYAEFMARGLNRVIPVIYCFTQGIVFDILTVMDANVMQVYFARNERVVKQADTMSDSQFDRIRQENPYQELEIEKVWLNGHCKVLSVSSQSVGAVPGRFEGEIEKAARDIKKGYPEYLEDAACFFCQRVCIKTGIDYTQEKVRGLELKTREEHRTEVLDLEVEVNPGEEKKAAFIHPVTGHEHQVFFYDTELIGFPNTESEIAVYIGTAEVVPCLSANESFKFDSSLSFTRKRNAGKKGVGAVSVIGGSMGPTAIFLAGKEAEEISSRHGGQIIPCFSKPYWPNEEGKSSFHITGLDRIIKNAEIIQVLGE